MGTPTTTPDASATSSTAATPATPAEAAAAPAVPAVAAPAAAPVHEAVHHALAALLGLCEHVASAVGHAVTGDYLDAAREAVMAVPGAAEAALAREAAKLAAEA